MITGSIYCTLAAFQASFKAFYMGYFIQFFPQTYVWLFLIFILLKRKWKPKEMSTLPTVTDPVSSGGGTWIQALTPLPFLLAEVDNLENSSDVCARWGSEAKTNGWHSEEQNKVYELRRTAGTTNIVQSECDVARFEIQESQHYRKWVEVRIQSPWGGEAKSLGHWVLR